MLVTFISISRISTARHPSGFEIRCKKMFNLLNPGICNPVNKQKRRGCVISLWRTLFYVIYCIILEVS